MASDGWALGGVKDQASITKDWKPIDANLPEGVVVHEIRNVPTGYGYLTELFRVDWGLMPTEVGQVFQSVTMPGRLSAWHAHEVTTDRLFVSTGFMLIALYDGRPGSSTQGTMSVLRVSSRRPQLVVVPPKVWHGVKNVGGDHSVLVNIVDTAYQYDGPDHFRLPPDAEQIPFDILKAT